MSKNYKYNTNKESQIVSEAIAPYYGSFQLKNNSLSENLMSNLTNPPNSSDLLNKLFSLSKLSQKILAEDILELNIKTLMGYASNNKNFPSKTLEHLLKLVNLYNLAIDIFPDSKSFNKWLKKPAYGLGNLVPLTLLKTNFGLSLVFDELKRIEFGATA